MTKKQIILAVCNYEGKTKQVNVAQMSEIINVLDWLGVLVYDKPKAKRLAKVKSKKAKKKK